MVEDWVPIAGLGLSFLIALGGVISFFRRVIREKDADHQKALNALKTDAAVVDTELKSAVAELHRRVDEVQRDFSTFRENVPHIYATNAYLKDVETRLTTNIRETENRLTSSIDSSENRIVSHFTRIEDRLDRILTRDKST